MRVFVYEYFMRVSYMNVMRMYSYMNFLYVPSRIRFTWFRTRAKDVQEVPIRSEMKPATFRQHSKAEQLGKKEEEMTVAY